MQKGTSTKMYPNKPENFHPEKDMQERRQSYSHYVNEVREGNSSNEGSSQNLTMGYHRSSSSSTASSGKQLVKPHSPSHNRSHNDTFYGRFERGYNNRDGRYIHHHRGGSRRGDGLSSSSPSPSPELLKKKPPMFFLGPPSTPESSRGYHSPLRSSPSPSPEMPSTPENDRLQSPHLLHPTYGLELHPAKLLTPPDKNSKISSIYDAYWHIPRASLWCKHNNCEVGAQKCSQCQLQEETISNCSSVNPPPTFTAMDNYHPIRKRPSKCSCGAVFVVTTIFSTIVLALIAAFILYIEMVLKQNEYVPNPM